MRDRCDDDALQITQGLLAEMLGAQRPSVTNAARELERGGFIARGRRLVTILDRHGLVAASCECISWSGRALLLTFPKHTRKMTSVRTALSCCALTSYRRSSSDDGPAANDQVHGQHGWG